MKRPIVFVSLLFLLLFTNRVFAQEDDGNFPVFDFQNVTEKIFNATFSNHVFVWKPDFEEKLLFSSVISKDGYCRTILDTAIDYVAGGENYMVLAFSTIGYDKGIIVDCHSCATVISVALFKNENYHSFTLMGLKKGFAISGGSGHSAPYMLEKLGPEEYTLVIISSYMGQGDYVSNEEYFSLDPIPQTLIANGSFLRSVLSLTYETGSLNKGESEKISVKTIPDKNKSFYDLLLTTTKNGKVLPAKSRLTFYPAAGVYIPAR